MTTAESSEKAKKDDKKSMKERLYKEQVGRLGLFSLEREMTERKCNRTLRKSQLKGNYYNFHWKNIK